MMRSMSAMSAWSSSFGGNTWSRAPACETRARSGSPASSKSTIACGMEPKAPSSRSTEAPAVASRRCEMTRSFTSCVAQASTISSRFVTVVTASRGVCSSSVPCSAGPTGSSARARRTSGGLLTFASYDEWFRGARQGIDDAVNDRIHLDLVAGSRAEMLLGALVGVGARGGDDSDDHDDDDDDDDDVDGADEVGGAVARAVDAIVKGA